MARPAARSRGHRAPRSTARARLRYARLRHQAAVEDVDYRAARGLDRALFQKLAGGRWIEEAQNLIIEGPTGVGKSWLACALGHKACRDNRSVLYQRIPRMFADLALARGDGRYPRLMRALGGVKLLILDDWGLEPLGPEQRHDLLEIVEERYGRGATLITSQIPVDRWHDLIGEPTLADAILDRIVHNAHRLQLRGESLRKKRPQTSPLDRPTAEMERSHPTSGRPATPADINRNGRPTSIGTGGRLRIGMPGRHHRNPQRWPMASTIDTLRLAKRFKDVRLSDEQAELFAEVFRETQEAGAAQLATKADLERLELTLRADLERVERTPLRADLERDGAPPSGVTSPRWRRKSRRLKFDLLKWIVPLVAAPLSSPRRPLLQRSNFRLRDFRLQRGEGAPEGGLMPAEGRRAAASRSTRSRSARNVSSSRSRSALVASWAAPASCVGLANSWACSSDRRTY